MVEPCPITSYYSDYGTGDNTVYKHFTSYLIDFGSPNPSSRVSDIYRNKVRPIIYSATNINFSSFKATLVTPPFSYYYMGVGLECDTDYIHI